MSPTKDESNGKGTEEFSAAALTYFSRGRRKRASKFTVDTEMLRLSLFTLSLVMAEANGVDMVYSEIQGEGKVVPLS